ncbi:MAG: hypothetical protein A2V62_13400 [Nitrospirae bacterium RBG_19FT_COMBO_58_9]|nr:MAG: hypothetical protein A2V62_13400 [Nitrospirae bacterium RBG_19FT_COMBO_58_9]
MARLNPGFSWAPIFQGRSWMISLSALNNVEKIKKVAQAGTRVSSPAKEYCHIVFDIDGCSTGGIQEDPSLAESVR